MKIFFYTKNRYDTCKTSPVHEACFALGRILGKLVLFGAGYCVGQIVRGLLQAFGFVVPSLF